MVLAPSSAKPWRMGDVDTQYVEHDRKPRTWVCGDPEESDEEDDGEREFVVRPGLTVCSSVFWWSFFFFRCFGSECS